MLSYPGYVFSRRIAFVVLSYPGYVVSIAALDFAYYYLEILLRDFVFFSVCDHIIICISLDYSYYDEESRRTTAGYC